MRTCRLDNWTDPMALSVPGPAQECLNGVIGIPMITKGDTTEFSTESQVTRQSRFHGV